VANDRRAKPARVYGPLIPIPSDDDRRVVRELQRRRRGSSETIHRYVLLDFEGRKLRTVGWHHSGEGGRVIKHIKGGSHVYGNVPGIAWNLELLALLDRLKRRPDRLVVINDEPQADGRARKPYRVPFTVARAFALAATIDGDDRWLVTEDVDDQVVIPWPAWRGQWTEPPPRPPDEDEVEEPAQVGLFTIPQDPKPIRHRHPV
jgi:hypothetical protein